MGGIKFTRRDGALPAAPTINPFKPDDAPVFEHDDDGLAGAIAHVGAAVRWNLRSRQMEIRRAGEDDYRSASAEVVDDLMAEIAKHCYGKRTATTMPEPYRLGARWEKRLLGVVARHDSYEGDGGGVYNAVVEWSEQQRAAGVGRRLSLSTIMEESGVLHRYESAARVPAFVAGATKNALSDQGWSWRVARVGTANPRKLWCSPWTGGVKLVPPL